MTQHLYDSNKISLFKMVKKDLFVKVASTPSINILIIM